MKLIGLNSGRRIIAFMDPSQGVNAKLNVNTQTPLILDNQGGAVQAGATTWNQGSGIFLGFLNGIPVFSVGTPSQGMTWDGAALTVIGNILLGIGNSLSSGETAFQTGVGFWLGTTASGAPQFSLVDQFGNYIKFDGSSSNPISISSNGVINVLSSKQIDDGAWKTLAAFNFITGLPTTRAGFGITDAQATLPNATSVGQVLQRDNGGNPYFSQKYGSEILVGTSNVARTGVTAVAPAQIGNTLGIPNPGNGINFAAVFNGETDTNLGTEFLEIHLQYSKDGGTSWIDLQAYTGGTITIPSTTNGGTISLGGGASGVNCTGDLQFRMTAGNVSGVNTIRVGGNMTVILNPNSGFYSIAGALSATIPATASGNCNAAFPATTCTASVNVTVAPSGGAPAYSYAWSVVSGTGTITAGSTSQTCTVSDTETATSGGATFNTTIKCVVTDTFPHNVTTGNCVITNTFTSVFNPISGSVANADGSCSRFSCPGTCAASGTLTANAIGGNGSYTYSWSITSGSGTITSGSTSQTCTISQTHATTAGGTVQSTTGRCAVNDSRGTGSVNMSGTVNLTFTCNS